MNDYLTNLQIAVAAMFHCDCQHLETSHVIEYFEGAKVWEGNVEIFELFGQPLTKEAFAWGYDLDGEPQYIAVLKVQPIVTPSDAVRAAIASGDFV